VLQAVIQASDKSQLKLAAGATLVEIVREVFGGVARYGASFAEHNAVDKLGAKLEEALSAGLTLAEKELGRQLDRPAVPAVLGGVVENLLCGELVDLDSKSKNFQKLFNDLASAATA
jgi:hypothetical protein